MLMSCPWNCGVNSSGLDLEHTMVDGAAVGHVDGGEECGLLEEVCGE